MTQQKIRKAIFPVGGLGTRFLPATKAMPKEMLPIVDKPLIQYAVEEAMAAGIEQFIFVTGRGKSAIEDHFDQSQELVETLTQRGKTAELAMLDAIPPRPGAFAYLRQMQPKGLGHAVWCARHLVGDEPVAILLADDLVQAETSCLKQMVDIHAEIGGNLVAIQDVPAAETGRYGIVDPGRRKGRLVAVKGLVEKPHPASAPSRLAVIGRYILEPEVFRHLDRQKPGADGEIQLTDALARMAKDRVFHGFRFAGRRFDCGDKAGYVEANIAFALRHPKIGRKVARLLNELAPESRRIPTKGRR